MDVEKAIIRTLAFFDLFDQPLTVQEIRQFLWAEEKIGLTEIINNLISIQKVEADKGFYFLSGRSVLVGKREERELWQDKKMAIAQRAGRLLSLVPFVRLVAVCNTLGFAMAKEDSDIDFFIVAKHGRLWLVRFCSAMLLSLFGLRRHGQEVKNKVCLSFFITDNNLDLRPIVIPGAPDIYLIYWLMNLVPLVDRGNTLEKFWQANLWVKNYVANWDFAGRDCDYRKLKVVPVMEKIIAWKEKICARQAGDWLENILKKLQLKKISGHKESKINLGGTAVIVNDQMLKFHEEDRRDFYRQEWEKRYCHSRESGNPANRCDYIPGQARNDNTNMREYLIYFLLFILPWQTRLILRHDSEYDILGVFATEILLWLVFLLSPKKSLKYFWLVLFLSILSLVVATDELLVLQQLVHLVEAGILFFLISSVDKLKATYTFLAGLVVQAGLAWWQFITQSTFASRWLGLTLHDVTVGGTSVVENTAGRCLRAYGALPHPNILGGYLALGILLIALLFYYHVFAKQEKYVLWIVGAFLVSALVLTFSRSAILSLVVVLFLILWQKKRESAKFSLMIFLIMFACVGMLWPVLHGRVNGDGRLEAKAITERVAGYHEAWALFKQHPVLGVGLGNYTLALERLKPGEPAWYYQPVHNVPLLLFVEIGIFGLVILFLFLRKIKFPISNFQFPIIVFFILIGLFDHYLWSLWSGVALVAVGWALNKKIGS